MSKSEIVIEQSAQGDRFEVNEVQIFGEVTYLSGNVISSDGLVLENNFYYYVPTELTKLKLCFEPRNIWALIDEDENTAYLPNCNKIRKIENAIPRVRREHAL